MNRLLSAVLISVALVGAAFANKASHVTVAGVQWLNSFEAAKSKAASSGKLILHLQMFGDLDDAYC